MDTSSTSSREATSPLRIVVTGAAGFVGSHVVESLAADPRAEVVATDVAGATRLAQLGELSSITTSLTDLRDPAALTSLIEDCDVVVHLAAVRTQASSERPRDAHDVNVGALYDLLTAARATGTKRFVFGSSHTVYGSFDDPHRESFTEDQPWPLSGLNMYAATKLAGEAYLEAFASAGGPDYVSLRLGTIYGPRSGPGGNASLMTDLLEAVRTGTVPTIPWASNALHGLIHVTDVAEAIRRAVFSSATRMPINVSGVPRTSREIYGTLAQLAGADPDAIVFDESRSRFQLVSQERMRSVLDFTPAVELEEGLRSVIEWAGTTAVS